MNTKRFVTEEFKLILEQSEDLLYQIVKLAERLDLTNEQCYLDWEDKLNNLSIKDHNDWDIKKGRI